MKMRHRVMTSRMNFSPLISAPAILNSAAVSAAIDQYSGHSHCTGDFSTAIYHYHVKTVVAGGQGSPLFWITNSEYYGVPGSITNQ